MERVTKEFEIEIGKIRYTFTIEFSYHEGNSAIDPTEQEESELYYWEFVGPIHAWDMEEETEYFVEDEKEIKMIIDWLGIDELFNKALS